MAGEKLIRMMKECAKGANPPSEKANVLFGKVTSVSPLKILVENRYEVDSNFLILSPFCTDFKGLWEGLKVDDTVNMLRFDGGQNFYVLDKGTE